MRPLWLSVALVAFASPAVALDLDALVAKHAAANNVPEALVRRVIKIESRGQPHLISMGNYGLMQIRLGTARAMGYTGDGNGLLDADTNMTYAVRYLAGAYRAADGNADRAVHFYQRGYYYDAKAKGFSPYRLASQEPTATAPKTAAAPKPTLLQPAAVTAERPLLAPAEQPAVPKKTAKTNGQPFNLLSFFSYYGTAEKPAEKKRKATHPVAKATAAAPVSATPAAATPIAAAATPAAQKP